VPTEVWFRNPDNYIRELVECGQHWIAWDRGLLVKKRIDAEKHAALYFGKAYPYRLLLVGDQGTAELTPDHGFANPKAVYPTWEYGEDAALLEEIIAQPVGEDAAICSDMSVPPDERPVLGQEHRVVVIGCPPSTSGPGRKFLRYLKELQEDYPDCIIHLHGMYAWRPCFGMGLRAADVEPRTSAQKGRVHLPSGREEKFESVVKHPQWVTALGFRPVDLAVPRNRCMYNIKSAVWAGENYEKLYNFPNRSSSKEVDHTSPTADFKVPETRSALIGSPEKKPGDMFHCDTCSLQDKCRYFRDGAVCSVPGAEPTELARYFKTRDSGMIIDGLGTLLAAQTRRMERGLEYEEIDGELSPEVTRMMTAIFDEGVKLAKLVDPSLRGNSGVNINVGAGGAAAVGLSNPKQLIASAVRELEARGINRDDITPELIQGLLTGMAQPGAANRAIEGEVISRDEAAS
jgi:hypothetical protein